MRHFESFSNTVLVLAFGYDDGTNAHCMTTIERSIQHRLFLLGIASCMLLLSTFFLVAVAVNFACLGRDVWCSIALYCSFFFTIAVTMRSNWGGSNNPFPFHLLSIIVVIIIISLQVDDYYNKTAAGKKGYRAFSLSLCNHNNHLPWYCRAEPKPPTLKHASRKTMSVSEAQWSFFLQFVTSSCNHTDFERSELPSSVYFEEIRMVSPL